MDDKGLSSVKTHKRKSKNLVDPGDLVSEKSLQKSYKILGQVGDLYRPAHRWYKISRQGEGIERLLVKTKKEQLEENFYHEHRVTRSPADTK